MKYLPVSIFDAPGIETWLETQAAAGRHLRSIVGDTCARFRKGEPMDCRYYLEPQLRRPNAPDQETVEAYGEAGWEFVCGTKWRDFYIWRSTRPDPEDLHTDPTVEGWGYDFIAGAMRRRWVLLGLVLAIPLGVLAIRILAAGTFLLPLVRDSGVGLWYLLLALCLLPYLIWIEADDLLALRRIRRSLDAGVPLERENRTPPSAAALDEWGYRAVLVLFLLVSVSQLWALTQETEDPVWEGPLPCIDARDLGADYAEREVPGPGLMYNTAPLAPDVLTVVQGTWRTERGPWHLDFDTRTDCLRLRFGWMAAPVLWEARHDLERTWDVTMTRLEDAPFDDAWYGAGDGVQCFAARRDGWVVYLRTDAPEDLRPHVEDLAAVMVDIP